MALAERKEYTLNDIYALPEGVRAELIDGQIYYMAPPVGGNYNLTHDIFLVRRKKHPSYIIVPSIMNISDIIKNKDVFGQKQRTC